MGVDGLVAPHFLEDLPLSPDLTHPRLLLGSPGVLCASPAAMALEMALRPLDVTGTGSATADAYDCPSLDDAFLDEASYVLAGDGGRDVLEPLGVHPDPGDPYFEDLGR